MTDYIKASGDGSLMIRDLGSNVEFWVQPAYSSFYWTGLSFTVTVNGYSTDYSVNISGNAWYKVSTKTVSSSQTVTFKLNTATGTTSLAGPTTFNQYISRATVPPAPDAPVISSIKDTSVYASFTDNGNGGDAIDNWAIAYNTTTTPGTTVYPGSGKAQTISGLAIGTKYYFWSRVHNSLGWSAWSPRSEATTKAPPNAPSTAVISQITQTSVYVTFNDNFDGGSPITDREIGYGTDPNAIQQTVKSDKSTLITGLQPYTRYFFWTRAANAYGWSQWGSSSNALTIAGAWILNGTTWVRAVPYVNVGGVWKVARPWGKIAGVWKECN